MSRLKPVFSFLEQGCLKLIKKSILLFNDRLEWNLKRSRCIYNKGKDSETFVSVMEEGAYDLC